MVIVKLNGGLGNQMFQYAAARSVALNKNVPLKLDVTTFQEYKLRVFGLDNFCITAKKATAIGISMARNSNLLSRLINKVCPRNKFSYVQEKEYFEFDPEIFKLPGNLYMVGYWQNERYFRDIENIIRAEFKVKRKPDAVNRKMAQSIMAADAVSLHIRRGDYVTNKTTNEVHGVCSLEYYYTAVREITKALDKPHFFVFSDDPQWVQDNLVLDYPTTFVIHNGPNKDHEDLRLMALCKHHIIANSSFSWWGAWLCTNPGKIVFAPNQWFRNGEFNTEDLIPETWHRI